MEKELQLGLLGSVELRQDGILVTGFNSSKVQALLCYLAVTGRSHLRPTLAGLLWGELPQANARNNLRKAPANLRQLIAPYLVITREAIAFNRDTNYWLDVERFKALAGGVSAEGNIAQL